MLMKSNFLTVGALALTLTLTIIFRSAAFAAETSRFGGPSYPGSPALSVTSSLVQAGGGPADFSIAKAIESMVGPELTKAEVEKLSKQYGKDKVGKWIEVFDFAVKEALKMATDAGVKLPMGELKGKKLAEMLVKAGLDKENTFWTCYMLDKAISRQIHVAVLDKIDAKWGVEADADYHRITNQAMTDVAMALGHKNVKLSSFH
jgi:hypothetical protein